MLRLLSRFGIIGALVLSLSLVSTSWAGADEKVTDFNIPPQALDSALLVFAEQADVQVSVSTVVITGLRTQGVVGQFTPSVALSRLLTETGLQFMTIGDRTYSVSLATSKKAKAERVGMLDADSRRGDGVTRLAQSSGAANSNAPNDARAESQPYNKSFSKDQSTYLGDVVVTGSRLRRPANEGPAAVVTFDRTRISQLGATNVADVLNYLPQQSFWNNEQQTTGTRTIQLRGLSLGTTLVLVNGRRTVTSALTSHQNTFDLNSIPLSAVERVEVLSGSASAVYGTDAVGGVVNIILRDEIKEPIVDLYYGFADGGADERRGSISVGHGGERLRASVIFDAFKRDLLLGEHRDRFFDQDFRRYGGSDFRVARTNPGNVCSVTGENLPGLPTPCAAVPEGSTGRPSPAAFLPTAGQTRLDSINRFRGVVPETTRYSGVASAAFDFTEYLAAFGEFTYSNIDTTTVGVVNTLSNRTVPASNAFNPFGVPVSVNYRFAGIESQTSLSDSELFRGVAGLRGELRSWDWELSLLDTHETGSTHVINQLSAPLVNAGLAATDPNLALNVFADGPAGSPALLASLIAPPFVGEFASDGFQGSAFVRGDLFSGPAGPLGIVVGAERRKEEIDFKLPGFVISAGRNSSAGFGEVRMPLVNTEMHVPLAKQITITVAGRYDHYSDFGNTFNPEYGAEWRPFTRLLVRASHGTSFRAPSLFQLHQPVFTFPAVITDPRRNNEIANITQSIGGNPNLEAEESRSGSAGLVWMPGEFGKLHISADYWQIKQDSRLQDLSASIILTNESLFSSRVQRAPPTAADTAAGMPGQLLSIDSATINFGELETSGIDFQMTALLETALGRFTPTLTATWVRKYDAADIPNVPTVERAGVASIQGTIPRWRATAGLAWNRAGVEVLTTARYISSYDDVNTANVRTGRTVEPPTIVDLQGSIEFSEFFADTSAWLEGMTLRVGIVNLFDEEAAFSEVRGSSGFDPSQADLRQRFAYVSLSKRF